MGTTKIPVNGETPFQVSRRSFGIGESATGYTLYSSVDCSGEEDSAATWKAFSETAIPADSQHDVIDIPAGRWWKLVGNVGRVWVRF